MEHKMKLSTSIYTTGSILIVALLTAIGGELKLTPFENAPFRFGLGSIIFFLAILIRPLPIFKTGFITGMIVVIFRILLDQFFYENHIQDNPLTHLPAGLFYLSFAFFLSRLNLEKNKLKPIALGLYGTLFEVLSNLIEDLFIVLLITKLQPFSKEFLLIVIIAFIRSFSVVGIYSAITITEQKKQVQQLLNIGSNLYVEALYLKKSLDHIEKVTSSSFELYKQLKLANPELSLKALSISQEIHEVKKDGQRIYSGLSKVVNQKMLDAYLISELLNYVVEANQSYSAFLNKKVQFHFSYKQNFYTKEPITLLALLNNLVSNAVEAIEKEGLIQIIIDVVREKTTISVIDNGIGIPETFQSVIFDPGFTTKYNDKGEASTGIGLSHVQSIIEKLEGQISVESNGDTKFTVIIPTYKLQ